MKQKYEKNEKKMKKKRRQKNNHSPFFFFVFPLSLPLAPSTTMCLSEQTISSLYECIVVDEDTDNLSIILENNPDFDVCKCVFKNGRSLLHIIVKSEGTKMLKIVLSSQNLTNVNTKNDYGFTPLHVACMNRNLDAVKLLLEIDDVKASLFDNMRRSALYLAVHLQDMDMVEQLMISGKDLGSFERGNEYIYEESLTPIELAKDYDNYKLAGLLERFKSNPHKVRHELRVKLVPHTEVASLFAMIVFICDDLLSVVTKKGLLKTVLGYFASASSKENHTKTCRFFNLVTRLPMELQMLVCHRYIGSSKNNISVVHSETAFGSLAKSLSLSQK